MKKSKYIVMFVILVLALSGIHCKKSDDPTGPGDVDFNGTWVANGTTTGTKMIYDASETNPLFVIHAHEQGVSLTITVSESKYSLIITEPESEPETDTGTFLVEGKTITLTSDNVEEEVLIFDYTWDGDFLTLRAEDVTIPGLDIPAKLILVLKKLG